MDILAKEKKLEQLIHELHRLDDDKAIKHIKQTIQTYLQESMQELTAWDRVLLARHPKRPHALEVIDALFQDFIELHGDRHYEDDQAILGGIASFNGRPVTIIAHKKGQNTDENIGCNFGMAHPEGYRKAQRLMLQAQKFNRPIMTFIDTPGAFPGLGAEARGQGEAIAQSLKLMSELTVPILTVVVGEGGSGGALAIGMGNQVYMLENSIYSILSPEGYASILWKDASKAKEAAEVMKLTASDLAEFGFIDGIIKEPIGGAHRDKINTFIQLKDTLRRGLERYHTMSPLDIKEERYQKYRTMGFYQRFNYANLKGFDVREH